MAELAERLDASAVVVDVRQPDEYLGGHVPGAVLIPLNDVPDRYGELPTDRRGAGGVPVRRAQPTWPASSSWPTACEPSTWPAARWPGSRAVARSSRARAPRDGRPPLGRRRRRPRRGPCRSLRRADLRPRHRVPPGADVLPPARPAAAGVGWPTALIDPLAVDVAPLAALLDGPGLAILHAAQQDLEVLARACGTVPSRLFDTQLAAGFLGHATPSLANLVGGRARRAGPQGRPPLRLAPPARSAATSSPTPRPTCSTSSTLYERLSSELAGARPPGLGPRRVRGAADPPDRARPSPRTPGSASRTSARCGVEPRNIARAVTAWRERRAARQDLPTRFIISDLAVLGIAQRPPSHDGPAPGHPGARRAPRPGSARRGAARRRGRGPGRHHPAPHRRRRTRARAAAAPGGHAGVGLGRASWPRTSASTRRLLATRSDLSRPARRRGDGPPGQRVEGRSARR